MLKIILIMLLSIFPNAERAELDVAPLTLDSSMSRAAQVHANWMARTNTLAHSEDISTGAPRGWHKVGENVGRGGDYGTMWKAFMKSRSHRRIIVDPDYDVAGIGIAYSKSGKLYVTWRFADVDGK